MLQSCHGKCVLKRAKCVLKRASVKEKEAEVRVEVQLLTGITRQHTAILLFYLFFFCSLF